MNVRHKRQEDFLFKAIYSNEVQGRYIKGAPLFNARYMKRVLFLSKMVYTLRANVAIGQTFRGNSSKFNLAHILRLGRP